MKRVWHKAATLAAAFVIGGCSGTGETGRPSGSDDSILRPDTEVRGAKIYLLDRGTTTAEIDAGRIVKFEAQDSTMAYDLDIDILDSIGRVSTHVIGDSGSIKEDSGLMNIWGNVVVVTQDSTRLETDYLWWDSKAERIRTDAFVRITKGEDLITGWGLEADNSLSRIKILNQVSGTITDPEQLDTPQ